MIPLEQIKDYATRIGEKFHPEQIILFGSQARGDSNPDSDVDLLIVMPFEGLGMRKAVEIRLEFESPFPIDLIVRRPEEIENRIQKRDYFLQDIMDFGKILYDRRNC